LSACKTNDPLVKITIGELKYNKPEIKRLYSILRNQPYFPKRKTLDLPFQIRKNARMEAFGKRMHQIGYDIIRYERF
jgi:hypothetical protein